MRKFSQVSPRFWVGRTGRAIRERGTEAQLLALYLLTSPGSNMAGLYYVPRVVMQHETGLSAEAVARALAELIELGFCEYDETAEVVWVVQMALYQVGESLSASDKRRRRLTFEVTECPSPDLRAEFLVQYESWNLVESSRKGHAALDPSRGRGKTPRREETDTETETDTDTEKEKENRPGDARVAFSSPARTGRRVSSKHPDADRVASELVAHLNAKRKTRYQHTSGDTVAQIAQALNRGETAEQIRRAIDWKIAEWTGTEFEARLCPSTLFRPSNLPKYIESAENEPTPSKKRDLTVGYAPVSSEWVEGDVV